MHSIPLNSCEPDGVRHLCKFFADTILRPSGPKYAQTHLDMNATPVKPIFAVIALDHERVVIFPFADAVRLECLRKSAHKFTVREVNFQVFCLLFQDFQYLAANTYGNSTAPVNSRKEMKDIAPRSGQVVGCRLLTPLSPSTHTTHDPILASLSIRQIRRSTFCVCTCKGLDKTEFKREHGHANVPSLQQQALQLGLRHRSPLHCFLRVSRATKCWLTGSNWSHAYLSLGLPGLLIFDVFDSRSQVIQSGNFDRGVLSLHITNMRIPTDEFLQAELERTSLTRSLRDLMKFRRPSSPPLGQPHSKTE